MVELKITQQFGRIGLQITNARFELRHRQPDLEISRKAPELTLDIAWPELMVDYTPMLESIGLGNIEYRAKSFTAAAREEYLANLEKSVQVGYQIGAIEKGQSIGDIVFEASAPREPEIGLVPLVPVKISYKPAGLDMETELGKLEFNFIPGEIKQEKFVFPSVKVFWEQKPYLKIEAVGQLVDIRK
ncbi:MAG TPA: hypothetical protein GXX46_00740 [Peptococcaceae bacterium]|nr:hypothetical protein [Peptococcaceae bacterium]